MKTVVDSLARVGKERIDEAYDLEIAINRTFVGMTNFKGNYVTIITHLT